MRLQPISIVTVYKDKYTTYSRLSKNIRKAFNKEYRYIERELQGGKNIDHIFFIFFEVTGQTITCKPYVEYAKHTYHISSKWVDDILCVRFERLS